MLRFSRVILHGEAGFRVHSHSREVGLTRLWWIQGAVSATLTVVGVDKITTQWGFNGTFLFICYYYYFFKPKYPFFLTE
jgi:hypothetical protein